MAGIITGDEHLTRILEAVPYYQRRATYNELKPHLSFKPKPFFLLKFKTNGPQT